jgi:hypothetical protein
LHRAGLRPQQDDDRGRPCCDHRCALRPRPPLPPSLLFLAVTPTDAGSANVNDRSLAGPRDSEIAVLVCEERPSLQTVMNGRPALASSFAQSLRMTLWQQHLGIGAGADQLMRIADPVSDASYHGLWRSTAIVNTLAHEVAFPGVPSNRIARKDQLRDAVSALPAHWLPHAQAVSFAAQSQAQQMLGAIRRLLPESASPVSLSDQLIFERCASESSLEPFLSAHVRGSLVMFPLNFLSAEPARLGMLQNTFREVFM